MMLLIGAVLNAWLQNRKQFKRFHGNDNWFSDSNQT